MKKLLVLALALTTPALSLASSFVMTNGMDKTIVTYPTANPKANGTSIPNGNSISLPAGSHVNATLSYGSFSDSFCSLYLHSWKSGVFSTTTHYRDKVVSGNCALVDLGGNGQGFKVVAMGTANSHSCVGNNCPAN